MSELTEEKILHDSLESFKYDLIMENWEDSIITAIAEGEDLDELVEELYFDELNYNNADTSSGQNTFEREDLIVAINTKLEELKKDEDHCSECARLLEHKHYIQELDQRSLNDTYDNRITIGYVCDCGYREDF